MYILSHKIWAPVNTCLMLKIMLYIEHFYCDFWSYIVNLFYHVLKPKNLFSNADSRLKICDFSLARVAFNDTPITIFCIVWACKKNY